MSVQLKARELNSKEWNRIWELQCSVGFNVGRTWKGLDKTMKIAMLLSAGCGVYGQGDMARNGHIR